MNSNMDDSLVRTTQTPAESFTSYEQRTNDGVDVTEIHSVVYREKTEPREGSQPLPIVLILLSFALLMFGGWYLGSHSANFVVNRFEGPAAFEYAAPNGSETKPRMIDPMLMGKRIFNNCAACHQSSGLGLPGRYPPLDGSDIVNGREDNLARIVLHGLAGPIEVHGRIYDGKMPEWSRFDDRSLAAVLTYVRASWSNKSGPVSEELVAEVRKVSSGRMIEWTVGELESAPVVKVEVHEPPEKIEPKNETGDSKTPARDDANSGSIGPLSKAP